MRTLRLDEVFHIMRQWSNTIPALAFVALALSLGNALDIGCFCPDLAQIHLQRSLARTATGLGSSEEFEQLTEHIVVPVQSLSGVGE